jgi:hypothetical protein
LVIVKVSVDVPPTFTEFGANDLSSEACATVKLAEAVVPVIATGPVALTVPLVLLYVPAVGAVTFTLTVHVPPMAMAPPVKVRLVAPPAGAKVGAPQLFVEAEGVAATTIAAGDVGSVSVNATPLSAAELPAGHVIENVSVLVPPGPMVEGVNDFVNVGAPKTTRFPVPPVVVGPLVAVTLPMLFTWPAAALIVLLVTWTVTVHDAPAASCAPESATLGPLAAAVTVPPVQFVAPAGVPEFVIAAGYVSVNAMPVTVVVVFGLFSVIVRVDVPPDWIDEGEKALVAVMPDTTVSVVLVTLLVSFVMLVMFAAALV